MNHANYAIETPSSPAPPPPPLAALSPPPFNRRNSRNEQAYFAKFRISDESYFQTTLCHPHAPPAFPVHNDNLRLVNWPYFDKETEWVLHPDPVQPKHVAKLMKSGALFARKFELGLSDRAWSNIEGMLSQKVCVCVYCFVCRTLACPTCRW